MRSVLIYIGFFVLSAVLVSVSAAQPTDAIALEPLPGGFLAVRATVRGHHGTFLFDSGSGLSNISPEFAAAIGCKPWGQISGIRMRGDRVDMRRCDDVSMHIATFQTSPATVGVLDLQAFLPKNFGHIDGTIALDAFASRALSFSYSKRRITLLDPHSLPMRTGDDKGLPIHLVRDAEGLALSVNLPVKTPLGTAWFEMDSGNTSSATLVGRHLAALLGLRADAADRQPAHLVLLGGTDYVGDVLVMDLVLDGNLGISFLKEHDVMLDLVHARAWID